MLHANDTAARDDRLGIKTLPWHHDVGGQTSRDDALAIMDRAFDGGINFFDTANVYNNGESERIVGKWLKAGRNRVILATKVGVAMKSGAGLRPSDGRQHRCLLRGKPAALDTDYIDVFYLHAPDYQTPLEESLGALESLISGGKVRWAAVSNHAAWQIADMAAICEKNNLSQPV
jgi:aryl-alcohol dehydrogenase-like predicted oxidoreductase